MWIPTDSETGRLVNTAHLVEIDIVTAPDKPEQAELIARRVDGRYTRLMIATPDVCRGYLAALGNAINGNQWTLRSLQMWLANFGPEPEPEAEPEGADDV